jgi:lipopolysaccharide export system protein LptA
MKAMRHSASSLHRPCSARAPPPRSPSRSRLGVGAEGPQQQCPVDVSADRIEVQDRADRAIFAGNVHVTQAELSLDTTGSRSLIRAAQRGVQIRGSMRRRSVVHSPSETAKGDFGIYDLDRKLITLIGAVQLNRGDNQVNGSRLVIDLDSGRAVIDGGRRA